MKEAVKELKADVAQENYRAWYRCTNCGLVFEHDMKRGVPATNMDGECPMCGTKSGTAGIGVFTIVKYNHDTYDTRPRHYFM